MSDSALNHKELAARMNVVSNDGLTTAVRPKKVALGSVRWPYKSHVEFRSQNLGLGYIGAYAEKYGHKIVAFIDPMNDGGDLISEPYVTERQTMKIFGHPDSWFVDQIPADTEVVGLNGPFTDSRVVMPSLVRAIKARYPNMLVVIGGILATSLSRQVIEECPADIVVKGEGEIAFAKILNDVPLENIPGLVYRDENGNIFESSKRSEQLRTVDDIPPPGYHFRPMEKYVQWSPRGDVEDRTLSIITSKGCPFTCEFCSIPEKGQLWRPFNPERVLEEIKHAIAEWDVNHIEFEDDNFTLKEPRALKVLEYLAQLRSEGKNFSCSFPNGIMIDKMSEALAKLLVRAGSDIIYLPVESGDTRVLISMDKPEAQKHLETTLRVAKWCVDAGLMVSCFFIVGYPGGRVNPRYLKDPEFLKKYEKYILRHEKYPNDVFMMGEDEEAFNTTMQFAEKLLAIGKGRITASPLIATAYPGTAMSNFCETFNILAYPDNWHEITTFSYAGGVTADQVQIESPWCSREEMVRRWKLMSDTFPTHHNVRKKSESEFYTDQELRKVKSHIAS